MTMVRDWGDERYPTGPDDAAVGEVLSRYAAAALGPNPAAMARLRMLVVARSAAIRERRARSVGRSWRSTLALVAAVALVGALAGGALGITRPGNALYGVRLWLETLTLPGDAADRADAQIGRLDARLDEAAAGASAGNGAAVSAALAAYRETLEAALAAAGTDLEQAERLELVLARHRIVLETLASGVPDDAQPGIEKALGNAIEQADRAVNQIHSGAGSGQGSGTGTRPGTGAGQGNGNRPTPGGGPGQGNPGRP